MFKQHKYQEVITVGLLGFISTGFLFRHLLLCGFEESLINVLDGRFLVGVAEHWFLFIKGEVPWRELYCFYPVEGTLGFSDSLFLLSIPYSLFRTIGIGPYLSWDLVMILFALIGYASMYAMLSRLFKVSNIASHAGAVFFLLGAPMCTILNNSHHQLFTVWLLPLQVLFLSNAFRVSHSIQIKSFKWLVISSALYGGIAYTSFYVCWFFTLTGALVGLLWALLSLVEIYSEKGVKGLKAFGTNGERPSTTEFWKGLLKWVLAASVCLIALTPFFLTYLPVVLGADLVQYGNYAEMQPGFLDYINPGIHNIIYGDALKAGGIEEKPYFWELGYGMTPGFLVFCIIGIVLHFSRVGFRENKLIRPRAITALLCALLIVSLLILRIHDVSLWESIRKTVPGATAIRAVFRINILIYSCMLIVATVVWENIWKKWNDFSKSRMLIGFALVLVLVEQTCHSHLELRVDRNKERRVLEQINAPEQDIEAFFMGGINGSLDGNVNVSAFRIAQVLKIPSIQGFSGVYPAGSDLHKFQLGSPEYYKAVKRWIRWNNITGPIGELDLGSHTWIIHLEESLMAPYVYIDLDKNVLEQPHLEPYDYLQGGWSLFETWGVWSDANSASIALPVKEVPEKGLLLELFIRAFVPNKKHKVSTSVAIAGEERMKINFTRKNPEITISFPVSPSQFVYETLQIEFQTIGRTSPREQGLSMDNRKLGIGISSCVLRTIQ